MRLSVSLLEELLQQKPASEEEVALFALRHPVLLNPHEWSPILEWLEQQDRATAERGKGSMRVVADLYREFEDVSNYPFGAGPVEDIYGRQKRGEITLETARAQAADGRVYALLSPVYVHMLAMHTEQHLEQHPADWEKCIRLLQLLLATLDAVPTTERINLLYRRYFSTTVLAWLRAVGAAVMQVPDARLFASAERFGNELAALPPLSEKDTAPSRALHRLGALFLDPFSPNAAKPEYYSNWINSFYHYYGEISPKIADEALQLPSPEEALSKAVVYLTRAAAAREGHDKALSLKALAEAYYFLGELSGDANTAALQRCAGEALRIFADDPDYLFERTTLQNILRNSRLDADGSTAPGSSGELESLLNTPDEQLLEEYGPTKLFFLFRNYLSQYMNGSAGDFRKNAGNPTGPDVPKTQPPTVLAIWLKIAGILDKRPDAEALEAHHRTGIRLLGELYGPPVIFEQENYGTAAFAQELIDTAAAQGWPPLRLYAGVLALAQWSADRNEEREGLMILDAFAKSFAEEPALQPFGEAIRWLHRGLHIGEAVNLIESDIEAAAEHYLKALNIAVMAGDRAAIPTLLERLCDVRLRVNEGAAELMLAYFTSFAHQLEVLITPVGRQRMQDIYVTLFAFFASHPPLKGIVITLLLQYAKGYAFSRMLEQKARPQLGAATPEGAALLDALRKQLGAGDLAFASPSQDYLDEEVQITAYMGSEGKKEGTDPETLVHNLQISFDSLVTQQMLAGLSPGENVAFTPERLRDLIDTRTVLFSVFLGRSPSGSMAVYTVLLTKESMQLSMGEMHGFPPGRIQMEENGVTVNVHPMGFLTSETRKKLQQNPAPGRPASAEAMSALETDSSYYLGGKLFSMLEGLRAADKDHLCFVPHGATHYYPFHLLPYGDGILADVWKVTSLPNIHLLGRQAKAPAEVSQPLRELSSIGISFRQSNPYGLDPLDGAVAEVQAVAAVYDTPAIIDDAATEEAFYAAAGYSRRVHIATHGLHTASAPAFQALFLTPGTKSDGIVYAHELLGKDLSHLDLVTLSACQTALGRFDESDNILGLPATLLLGGVATIVGTLWQAETRSCEHFFVSFYTALKAGESKLDAFYTAQQDTRRHYPEYRDWGVFYFIGDAS